MNFERIKDYYFFKNGSLIKDKLENIPEDFLDYASFANAAMHFQHKGAYNPSLIHKIKDEYDRLCLAVLRHCVEHYGEIFPIVYRGVRQKSEYADNDRLILFGSRDIEVAQWYGFPTLYYGVKGIEASSPLKGVLNENDADQEIIFFPDI